MPGGGGEWLKRPQIVSGVPPETPLSNAPNQNDPGGPGQANRRSKVQGQKNDAAAEKGLLVSFSGVRSKIFRENRKNTKFHKTMTSKLKIFTAEKTIYNVRI